MQSTKQAEMVMDGGDNLEGQELALYRRRQRRYRLTRYQVKWLEALWPRQVEMLRKMAGMHDARDAREYQMFRSWLATRDSPPRNQRPRARAREHRPAASRRASSSSSTSSADPGDDDPEPAPTVLRAAASALLTGRGRS